MSGRKGFLTDVDKEFLRGEKEYTGENANQMRYQRRRAIREATRAAIADLAFLYEHLDDHELEKIVKPEDPDDDIELYHELRETLGFLYKLTKATPPWGAIHFDQILEQAVSTAERDMDNRFVDVRIYMNERPPEVMGRNAAEKIREERYDDMTVAEMRHFLENYHKSDQMDIEIPREYARWRYGTSKHPPKHGEMSFEEYLEQQREETEE